MNMKIPGAHLYIVSNECKKKIRKTHAPIFFRTCVDKMMSTDKRQTDTQGEHNIPPPPTSFAAGIKISYTAMMCAFVLNFSGFL